MNTKIKALQNEIAAHSNYAALADALGMASRRTIAKHKRHARLCLQELNRIDPISQRTQALTDDELLAELEA